jgi:ABC-2 type transport system permease protein
VVDSLRLYLRCLAASARAQMQYRASFVMLSIGQFLATGIEFVAIWAIFERFGNIRGWRLPEVALLYAMVNLSWALADTLGRGFDRFETLVKSGEFDRVLLRPRSAAFQVACRSLQIRVGRMLQAGIVLAWAFSALEVTWDAPRIALLVISVLGGMAFFLGLLVFQATLAFWTIESLEVMNTMTYGGVETAQYPLSIYRDWFRKFFTFVVPLAWVSYYPGLALVGRTDPLGAPSWAGWISPLFGLAFLWVATRVWRFGVRHYLSTGS